MEVKVLTYIPAYYVQKNNRSQCIIHIHFSKHFLYPLRDVSVLMLKLCSSFKLFSCHSSTTVIEGQYWELLWVIIASKCTHSVCEFAKGCVLQLYALVMYSFLRLWAKSTKHQHLIFKPCLVVHIKIIDTVHHYNPGGGRVPTELQ